MIYKVVKRSLIETFNRKYYKLDIEAAETIETPQELNTVDKFTITRSFEDGEKLPPETKLLLIPYIEDK